MRIISILILSLALVAIASAKASRKRSTDYYGDIMGAINSQNYEGALDSVSKMVEEKKTLTSDEFDLFKEAFKAATIAKKSKWEKVSKDLAEAKTTESTKELTMQKDALAKEIKIIMRKERKLVEFLERNTDSVKDLLRYVIQQGDLVRYLAEIYDGSEDFEMFVELAKFHYSHASYIWEASGKKLYSINLTLAKNIASISDLEKKYCEAQEYTADTLTIANEPDVVIVESDKAKVDKLLETIKERLVLYASKCASTKSA